MCGRAVQTRHSVAVAANSLGILVNFSAYEGNDHGHDSTYANRNEDARKNDNSPMSHSQYKWRDNFNLSPGMDAMVFYKDENGKLRMDGKVWGLVNKHGTPADPLPPGMGKHFEGLMFNARSDTLYQKPSCGRLASLGRSCLIAFDGFFEWKSPVGGKGKKQPYFVRRNPGSTNGESKKPYLLMAGLWNQVSTGWEVSPSLDTFTIITTEVCHPLAWLHSRMPVCVWDEYLAQQWLDQPTQEVHALLEQGAQNTSEDFFKWYQVTTDMSSTKFRSADAIKPLPKEKSVKDFFTPLGSGSKFDTPEKIGVRLQAKLWNPHVNKRSLSQQQTPINSGSLKRNLSSPPVTNKRSKSGATSGKPVRPPKKGTIETFFQHKTRKA